MTGSELAYKYQKFFPFVAALFAVILYWNISAHQFALDDFPAFKENIYLNEGVNNLGDIFSSSLYEGAGKSSTVYRPLTSLFYAAQISLFGIDSARAMHLVSILIYALIAFFLYRILLKVIQKPLATLIGTFVFIAHPIHTEVVANIKSQDLLWTTLFSLCAFQFLASYIRNNRISHLLLTTLFLCLASFSHEFALLLPLASLLYLGLKKGLPRLKEFGLILLPVALFLVCRQLVIDSSIELTVLDNALVYQSSRLDQLAMSFHFFLEYLIKLIWPNQLQWTYEYQFFPLHSWGQWQSIIGLLLFFVILVFCFFLWKKRNIYGLGAVIILLGLIPFTHLLLVVKGSFSETYLFFASIGFAILLALVSDKFILARYIVFALILLYSWKTVQRIPDWKNNETLYLADIEKAADCLEAQSKLAQLYTEKAQKTENEALSKEWVEKANSHYEKAINIYGNDKQTWFSFGMNHLMTGEYTMSELAFKEVIRLDPNYTSAYNNLGNIYYLRNERAEAKTQYELAVISNPLNAEALSNLGAMYLLNNRFDSAYTYLSKANQLEPENENTSYNLNLVKKKMGY